MAFGFRVEGDPCSGEERSIGNESMILLVLCDGTMCPLSKRMPSLEPAKAGAHGKSYIK